MPFLNQLSTLKHPLHPAIIMIALWSGIYFLYLCAPVILSPKITPLGTLFTLCHIFLFRSSAFFWGQPDTPSNPSMNIEKSLYKYDYLTTIIFAVGIISCYLVVVNNISKLQYVNFQSIAKHRDHRSYLVLHGELLRYNIHNFISVITFICTASGFISTISTILLYEKRSNLNKVLLYFFMISIFFVSVSTGSRGFLLIMLILIMLSCYSRMSFNYVLIPTSKFFRISVLLLLFVSIFYSNLVWTARSNTAQKTPTETFEHYKNNWGLELSTKPKKTLTNTELEKTRTIILPIFYFIHSLITTEKILQAKDSIPIMYGSYHIDLLSVALRSNKYSANFQRSANQILLEKNIYGFFAGAWGALFIDFGFFSFVIAIIWGGLSGRVWRDFYYNRNILSATIYTYSIYAILISFASPPFGLSNSFMLFIWLTIFNLSIKKLDNHQKPILESKLTLTEIINSKVS